MTKELNKIKVNSFITGMEKTTDCLKKDVIICYVKGVRDGYNEASFDAVMGNVHRIEAVGEQKMKIKTEKPDYTGCHPEIAAALQAGLHPVCRLSGYTLPRKIVAYDNGRYITSRGGKFRKVYPIPLEKKIIHYCRHRYPQPCRVQRVSGTSQKTYQTTST